jgi:hypothetical protein
MCGVNSSKGNTTANFVLYQLLELHKKMFKDGSNYLWQPISFSTEEHKLNCLAISHYLNGNIRAAKKTWKSILKVNQSNMYALHNLSLLNPLKMDHYLE